MGPAVTRLTIELYRDTDVIRGQLIDELGAVSAFHGWLGLASALERLVPSIAQEQGAEIPGFSHEP
jgi:hypothetical protein